jgi:hypothetical protein
MGRLMAGAALFIDAGLLVCLCIDGFGNQR